MIRGVPLPDDHGRTAGALYLAMVAYPDHTQAEKAQRWLQAIAILPLRLNGKKMPDPPPGLPKREHLWGIVSRGLKRIAHRRLPAVYLARRRLDGMSAMDAYRIVLDKTGRIDIDFVKKSCWRESQPVLAMAFPLWWLAADRPREMSLAQWLLNLAVRGDCNWLPEAMYAAQKIAPVLADAFAPKLLYYPYNAKSPVFDPRNPAQIKTSSRSPLRD